jgi:hypothetical protein
VTLRPKIIHVIDLAFAVMKRASGIVVLIEYWGNLSFLIDRLQNFPET